MFSYKHFATILLALFVGLQLETVSYHIHFLGVNLYFLRSLTSVIVISYFYYKRPQQ